MDHYELLFLILLFIVAVLYSGVGHGGASGYLALMGLFHFAPEQMRPAALVLNIFVSGVASYQFSRGERLNTKLFLWLILGSIPAAFLGSLITLDASIYKTILGVILIFQALRLTGLIKAGGNVNFPFAFVPVFITGVIIGFLSGIIGIGGGIILSPLLLLFGWSGMKQTALISALFIFVNSIAGIIGLLSQDVVFNTDLYLWVCIAFMGGMIGGYIGSRKIAPDNLKKLLGVVLIIAGIKLVLL